MSIEYSNYLAVGTTYRDVPATCPAQYRDRIANLRAAQPVERDASPKFKIGDHCKVAGENGGIICKVIKVSSPAGGIVTVQDGLGRTYDLTANFLEKVTLTSVAKFRIGDSVQVIGGGIVGTVSKVFGNLLDIKWSTGEIDTVLGDDLEKVERSFSAAVARKQEPLSIENQSKLLKRAELRRELWQAELRYSDDQPRDEKGRFGSGGTSKGESANDAKSHMTAAKAHMNAADKADQGDDNHSQNQAQAHFQAAAAHLQAVAAHNSSSSSLSQKDSATTAAQAASKAANKA